ncbi:hypothetical protein [Rhodopirellula sp. SWK7]|uniref:hypothetical protein n=1 Tax=Rhodopirellula sp. SWK7 TaxID=595460 RepID=UPI0002C0300B|nr:hypothetical protein [Rhodopirellula sp. SWK7]EMI47383.1 hypothetical protein RRSWK_00114 [Rhodopirellula sp. SWK7]
MTKDKAKKELTPNRVVCCILGCGSERADRILKKIGPRSSELVDAYGKGTARALLQQLRTAADHPTPAVKKSNSDTKTQEGVKTDGK